MKRKVALVLCFFMAVCFAFAGGGKETSGGAADVQYPRGDISIIIPNSAGGGNDLTVRALIPALERALGVSVVPINQPAGKGGVAFSDVANAKPDGSKLYFNSKTALLMKFNGIEEAKIEKLTPIAQVADDVAIFQVRSDSPWKTMNDVINHLKTSKEKLKTGNTGLGGTWHLPQIKLNQAIGLDNMRYASYPAGSPPLLTALVAGEVDFITCGPECKSFVDSGKVRPLCVVFPTRYPSFPDVPTLKEATGLDFDYPVWRGFFTTAGTDPKIVEILSQAIQKAVQSEEFQKYAAVGMLASYKGTAEFSQIVSKEQKELEVLMPEVLAQIQAENAGGK
ncbi:MAG: tripartite tricarboxylate transporter substrate binding protein [Spirochaetales bacterium]|nr:tripartite tricarboxylate transporter substrate binding protein [Spirochaetales bacterium]